MLRVDVRELRQGPVEVVAEIPVRDPLFEGLELDLIRSLHVSGALEASGSQGYLWHGRLEGEVRGQCRRCLRELAVPVVTSVKVLFSPDPDMQDDPGVYPLPEPLTHVDVRQAVREELALAVPAFPLCRDDCRGLCRTCGADLNQGPCGCGVPITR